jgi:hypothetical protein
MSENSATFDTKNPTDYQLTRLSLMTSATGDSSIDLLLYMVELNLFEDIFSSTISGNVVVSDALGMISNYFMNGTEFIEVILQKSNTDIAPISRRYRVYKISNRSTDVSNNFENYTINFCSEEFLLAEQYRVSKAFTGKKISDIVNSILSDYVKVGSSNVGTKKCYIDETFGVYDFILPNKKLFETINWLSNYAQTNSNIGADVIFFENSNGYWFKSLQSLYQQPAYDTFSFDPKNVSNDMNYQTNNVYEFEVLNFFDTLGAISNGTFSNRVITIDPLLRKSRITDFSYDGYFPNSKKLNNSALINNYKNRHGDTMYSTPNPMFQMGTVRLATSNSNQKKQAHIAGSTSKVNSVSNDIFIETYMPSRVSQIALANYMRLKITIPGNARIAAGMVVKFSTKDMEPSGTKRADEPFYSGNYLVTAVRHIVKNNSFITLLEIAKESSTANYSGIDDTNPNWKTVINGVQA